MTQKDLRECLRLARYVKKLVLNMDQEKTAYRIGMPWILPHYSGIERDHQLRPAYLGNKFMEELTPNIAEVNKPVPEAEGGGGSGQAKATDGMVETGEIEGRDGGLLDPPSLCSNLTSLTVRLVTAEFNEETLLNFVRSRRHKLGKDLGIALLRKLQVHFATGKSGEEKKLEEIMADEAQTKSKKSKKSEWTMLKRLENDPDVDLEGMDMEVSWSNEHTSGAWRPFTQPEERTWSPSVGLPCKCA
ncbi:hypothetical protein H1R20_g1326, partial [Candolleomyces eurysporus]